MRPLFASKLLSPAAPVGCGLLSADAGTALTELVQSVNSKAVAEIDSYYGLGNTPVLGRAVGPDGVLAYVDLWNHHGAREKAHFVANVACNGIADRIPPLRMWSTEAARMFLSGAFDKVFIDGSHSCECVSADIPARLPPVRMGGFLCDDDYDRGDYSVAAVVNRVFPAAEVIAKCLWVHRVVLDNRERRTSNLVSP